MPNLLHALPTLSKLCLIIILQLWHYSPILHMQGTWGSVWMGRRTEKQPFKELKDSLSVRFIISRIGSSSSSKLYRFIVTDLRSPLQWLFKCKSQVSAFPHHVPALVNSIHQVYSPRTIQEDESERDESEMPSALTGIYKLLEGVKHIIIKRNSSVHP